MSELTAEQFAERCGRDAAGINLRPALDLCKTLVLDGIDDNFLRRQTADGHAWPRRKDRKPHPLLEKTGTLRAAATGQGQGKIERMLEGNAIEVGVEKVPGTSLMGALAHQFGYPPGNIPQRQYLGISRFTLSECREATEESAAKELTLSWQ